MCVTIIKANANIIILSDGTLLVPTENVSDKVRQESPEILVENNLPLLNEAALNTFKLLLTLTNVHHAISIDEIAAEAIDGVLKPPENLHFTLPEPES